MEAGGSMFDLGNGVAGVLGTGVTEQGDPLIAQLCTHDRSLELPLALAAAAQEIGHEAIRAVCAKEMHAASVGKLSDCREERPKFYETYARQLGCKDMLTVHGHDPDGHGPAFYIPSQELLELSPAVRQQWERIAVHMATAHRLRRHLTGADDAGGTTIDTVPLHAAALLDPKRFLVSHAVGVARENGASHAIRDAAVRIDRARGTLRKDDPEESLRIWEAMVKGRWSLVDWFDTDGRRFVLATPNAPRLGDPRGLTEREHQVVTHASRGESSKLICYRLGISAQRVSKLLRDGMHKLGVKTPAQLVGKLRGLPRTRTKPKRTD
jgi:DNA-binding CsgD family transcriptional regulator